ncbi:MAG: hypothetical protein Tsb004_29710 [Allomuricauda sp.]
MDVFDDHTGLPDLEGLVNRIVLFQHHQPVFLEYKSRMSLKFIWEGKVDYVCGNTKMTLKSNEILLIDDNTEVNSIISEPTQGVSIFLPYLNRAYFDPRLINRPIPLVDSPLHHKLFQFVGMNPKKRVSDIDYVRNLIVSLVLYNRLLHQYYERLIYNRENTKLNIFPKLLKAKEIIERDYKTHISIDSLAGPLGISKFLFIRKFREAFGVTPVHFLIDRRIGHAKRLLAESDLLISDIADLTGFESLAHFSKLFKKSEGCSPMFYREHFPAIVFQNFEFSSFSPPIY